MGAAYPGALEACAGTSGMGRQWFPAAGMLLPAFLVVSASALSLLSLDPDTSDFHDGSKKVHLLVNPLLAVASAEASSSAEKAGWAPSTRAAVPSPEASGDHHPLLALSLALDRHLDKPAPWATIGPAEETLAPGSPDIAAMSLSQASPGPSHLTDEQKSNESPGSSLSVHASVSANLGRIPTTLRPGQPPAGGLVMGAGSASDAAASSGGPGASAPLMSSPSAAPPSASAINVFSLLPAHLMPSLPWTRQPGPLVPSRPDPLAALSFGYSSSLPLASSTSDSLSDPGSPTPGGADIPRPGQAVSLQDSAPSLPGRSHVIRSVTFRITRGAFSAALWNPASPEHQLLSKNIRQQLELIYQAAFSSFKGLGGLVFRPSSMAVNASLVFEGRDPSPSAHQVLWTLYCAVKAARQMLGNLPLVESSLASDGSTLSDLALETVSIRFTVMTPFLQQLALPGSRPFVLLEEQILRQVTPAVLGFYKEPPQEDLLLLFRNVDQWVGVYIEYKFQTPIPTNLRGLANHLARNVVDPALQKSSITANGEKAELELYEVLLLILGQPFTEALKDKTSPEFQELQGQLTRGLTSILGPLQNFGQVVVEEFQLDPPMARVIAVFFRTAPAEALVQEFVHQGLRVLQEAEGLSVELVIPDRGPPSPEAPGQPRPSNLSYIVALVVLSLLLVTVFLVLMLKSRACCPGLKLGGLKSHPRSAQ